LKDLTGEFKPVLDGHFLNDLDAHLVGWTGVVYSDNRLDLKLPATAEYTFQALPEWEHAPRRKAAGFISEMVNGRIFLRRW
jgi:hypothetical protein